MRFVPLEVLPFHILKALLCSGRPAKHHRLSVVVHIYLCIDSLSTMVVGCSSERCALTRDHDVHVVFMFALVLLTTTCHINWFNFRRPSIA